MEDFPPPLPLVRQHRMDLRFIDFIRDDYINFLGHEPTAEHHNQIIQFTERVRASGMMNDESFEWLAHHLPELNRLVVIAVTDESHIAWIFRR